MKLLALDTSSVACTVALQVGTERYERHEEQPREHTRILLPMIRSILDAAAIVAADLDAIILGNGPGSFIGMRIAASVAQGIAYAAGLKIVPVSSLATVAAEVFAKHDATEVIVAQDAHMHEVYLGLFRRDQDGLPVPAMPERLQAQAPIAELEQDTTGSRVAAGFGWQHYPALLDQNSDRIYSVVGVWYPRALHLLELGASGIADALDPQDLAPAYLRQKVAEKSSKPS